MGIRVLKTKILNTGYAGEVRLDEASDGLRYIHKCYPDHSNFNINDEWETLVFLYNCGYSVPKPVQRTETGMYMQYIENGTLWDSCKNADAEALLEITARFAKLLYELHTLKTTDTEVSGNGSFFQNEITGIRRIIGKYQFHNYLKLLDKLEALSVTITAQPLCYIHRDYHPWNVLLDKDGKLYVIDLVLNKGDFRFDIAWTYMLMSRSGYREFAEFFLSEYGKLNPNVHNDFAFFKQLANLRWLVNVKSSISKEGKNIVQTEKTDFMRQMINVAELLIADYLSF